jgi:hypothetical protein
VLGGADDGFEQAIRGGELLPWFRQVTSASLIAGAVASRLW